MKSRFPTAEELDIMSIEQIKALYPQAPEEEVLMQRALDKKILNVPITDKISRSDVPDIRTPEDEQKWQKILDERQRKIDIQFKGEAFLEQEIEKMEKEKEIIAEEEREKEIMQEMIPESVPEEVKEEKPVELPKEKKVHCEECGSKSPAFHKKGCSKIIKK